MEGLRGLQSGTVSLDLSIYLPPYRAYVPKVPTASPETCMDDS